MIKQLYRFLNPKFQNLFMEYKVNFKPRYGFGNPPHEKLYEIINQNRNQYSFLLKEMLNYKLNIQAIQKNTPNVKNQLQPLWNNGYLPGLDIIALYTVLATYKPQKYIEIGSGNSTKVAFKAKNEQKLTTQIISIDPQPRAEIDSLVEKIIRKPFEDIDEDIVEQLNENDILFIDNSHRILPNSDSMVFFLEVLPKLKKGVIVHIHDIYLPYDYPQFMCDRFYSEQYGLAMYLLANSEKYKPILPNFFISEDKELSNEIASIWNHPNLENVEKHGGSFWLQIQ